MVIYEHENTSGIFDTQFVSKKPVIDFLSSL